MEAYTLEQAEEELADLRGQVHRLEELFQFIDSQTPNTPAGGPGLYSLAGVPWWIRSSGLTGAIPAVTADTGTTTVTGTTIGPLSAVWTIPANDANVGTTYRLSAWGNGTWGSTQQALAFVIDFPAGNEFGTHQAVAAATFPISAVFRWNAILWITCLATGAGGTWHGSCNFAISETANSLNPGTASTNTIGAAQGPSSNVSQDTTVSNQLAFGAWWGSTTGAPTITCHGTLMERVGP